MFGRFKYGAASDLPKASQLQHKIQSQEDVSNYFHIKHIYIQHDFYI